jgi:hypothetical protein
VSERFLSAEDLDLAELSFEELLAWWDLWLVQAQCTNDLDEHAYSHGVFRVEPGFELGPEGVRPTRSRDEDRRDRHGFAERENGPAPDPTQRA